MPTQPMTYPTQLDLGFPCLVSSIKMRMILQQKYVLFVYGDFLLIKDRIFMKS